MHENKRRIIIDADSSPVISETIEIAGEFHFDVILIKDYAHMTRKTFPEYVSTQYVDTGHDAADYVIARTAEPGDIVITGDYGLASLLLPKGITVLHHNGTEYTPETIDFLLMTRYEGQMLRKSGVRTKGPVKFKETDRKKYKDVLKKRIQDA